jgi:hypothetical protein
VIPLAASSPQGGNRGRTLIRLVNYGAPTNSVLLGTYGLYTKATLLRPGADPLKLPTMKVGPTTEVTIPELGRVGVLMLG